MNGEEGINLDAFEPSWMEDGLGIQGEQQNVVDEDLQDWDTNAWSDDSQANEDFINGPPAPVNDCLTTAGAPPSSGEYFIGSVDGTCQWVGTTNCP